MVVVVIIRHAHAPIDLLVGWTVFHGIKYVVVNDIFNDTTLSDVTIDDIGIFITSDLYPEPKLLSTLINGDCYVSQCVSKVYEITGWHLSFCIIAPSHQSVTSFLSIPTSVNPPIKYVPDIAKSFSISDVKTAGTSLTLMQRAAFPMSKAARCDLLWDMVLEYWYKLSNAVTSNYYIHLWINACQCMLLRDGHVFHDTVKRLKQQSVFTSAIKRVDLGEREIGELLPYLEEGIDLGQCIRKELIGYTATIDVPYCLASQHVLCMNGKVIITPKVDRHLPVSAETTVISFYYDLGYDQKPKDEYIKSLRDFALIPHPLVFYGNKSECDIVNAARNMYSMYTLTIVKPVGAWDLVKRYTDAFNDKSVADGFKRSKRYAILTCSKFWAIEDVVRQNPFMTTRFAWLDCGVFRHKHIAPPELVGKPLFANTIINPGRVMMPSQCTPPGTTEDEFIDGIENVIAIAMISDKKGWESFLEQYKEFIVSRFDNGSFYTEQVMISRLVGIFPNIIDPRLYGFNQSQFTEMLNVQPWNVGINVNKFNS